MQFFLGAAGICGILIGVLLMSVQIIALGVFVMLLMCLFD